MGKTLQFTFKDKLGCSHAALTLRPEYVTDKYKTTGPDHKKHDNGWTVYGTVVEDYFYWVNRFTAVHKKHGKVWGDFEKTVYAETQEGFDDFYKNFPPEEWDYWDI